MRDIIDEIGIFPPMDDTCPQCAGRHDPSLPHERGSLYYHMIFYRRTGSFPTWADAMSHCSDAVKEEWTTKLKESGIPIGVAFDQRSPAEK